MTQYIMSGILILIILIGGLNVKWEQERIEQERIAQSTEQKQKTDSLINYILASRDSLIDICIYQDSIIRTWEDHAIRMKRIVGVPDTVEWSYETKCKYSINTSRLVGKNAIQL